MQRAAKAISLGREKRFSEPSSLFPTSLGTSKGKEEEEKMEGDEKKEGGREEEGMINSGILWAKDQQ